MAAVSALLLWLLMVAALAAPAWLQGEEAHCVLDRAHRLRYDIKGEPNDGSSMEGIEQALISMEPSLESCAEPSGDRKFCYGVNQDASCATAKANLPLRAGWDCDDCYVSAAADTFYKLNYSIPRLNSVEVGLRGVHLRTSMAVRGHAGAMAVPVNGSLFFPGSDRNYTLIDTMVGCPVCVRVKIVVGMPTSLDYQLSWLGRADLEAGANLDIHLGDNIVRYEHGSGWSHETSKPQVVAGSVLSAKAHADLELELALKTSLQVEVDKIMWYRFSLDPSVPLWVKSSDAVWPSQHDKVCVDADASFTMTQEADLDWDLAGWHVKKHYGPSTLCKWQKRGIVHRCRELAAGNSSVLLV